MFTILQSKNNDTVWRVRLILFQLITICTFTWVTTQLFVTIQCHTWAHTLWLFCYMQTFSSWAWSRVCSSVNFVVYNFYLGRGVVCMLTLFQYIRFFLPFSVNFSMSSAYFLVKEISSTIDFNHSWNKINI